MQEKEHCESNMRMRNSHLGARAHQVLASDNSGRQVARVSTTKTLAQEDLTWEFRYTRTSQKVMQLHLDVCICLLRPLM